MTRKINAHPRAMSRICHHAKGRREVVGTVGFVRPVMEGRGAGELVPEALGATTRSDRQTPSPATTLEDPLQFAETQEPARST
jgi:hypothetical protein